MSLSGAGSSVDKVLLLCARNTAGLEDGQPVKTLILADATHDQSCHSLNYVSSPLMHEKGESC